MWTIDGWYREARTETEKNADLTRRLADLFFRLIEEHLTGVPRDEVVRRLQASNGQRLDALPDLAKYPELRGMRDLVDAQWRG